MPATYGQTASSTSAGALVGAATPVHYGTTIKALPGNSGVVYVGLSNAVTTSTGYPLSAGDEMFVSKSEAADASLIFIIAATGTPGVAYRAV